MNVFNISSETLFTRSFPIISILEELLSTSSSLTDTEIYAQLENELGYSLSYIRDIFKLSTGMPLTKYITRRRYTNILLNMSYDDFKKLTVRTRVSGIAKFKSKCLNEFPALSNSYSVENLQVRIDETKLKDLIEIQISQIGAKYLLELLYGDIVKDRTPYEIEDNAESIILQSLDTKYIDLEKYFFVFKDKIFRITASCDTPQQIVDPFLDKILGTHIIINDNRPVNANYVVFMLHLFLTNNIILTKSFSIVLECSSKNGWGSSNLISSLTVEDGKIQEIEFVSKPFLVFDDENVRLDLSFFD